MHYKINIFFILFTIYLQAEKIESITLGNWNGWFLAIEANNQVYLQYGSSPEDMAFSEDENIDLKNLYNEIKPLLKESWEDESFNDSGKTLKNDDLRKQTISVNVIKTNTNHSEKAQYLRK